MKETGLNTSVFHSFVKGLRSPEDKLRGTAGSADLGDALPLAGDPPCRRGFQAQDAAGLGASTSWSDRP